MTPAREEDRTAVLRRHASVRPVMSPSCVVTVVEGLQAGQAFAFGDLASRRLLIGQSAACDVVLRDSSVSRRHIAVELDGAQLRLMDLQSSNGTFVNGLRIRDVYLAGGERIALGNTVLRIESGPEVHAVNASNETRFGRLIGASPAMRCLYPTCEKLAVSHVPVLIEGETGTGKEVLAEALHEASGRPGPFVVVDCTTIASTLLESELFGHERGAFTGADRTRVGLFEEAEGGTLFIDEIGDLELSLQAKLLRALERHEVRRVGGTKLIRINVRILAATRRDLEREVQERRFRDDLFYRLAVGRLELPPLRNREGDIALLARCFCALMGGGDAGLPADVIDRFEAYEWPGNVRELHNAVARHLALGTGGLPERRSPALSAPANGADFIDRLIAEGQALPMARQTLTLELERRYVSHMLALHDGNVGRAASASGIGRRYFQMLRAKR
jgi:DNA-binding NtrC family response regulator